MNIDLLWKPCWWQLIVFLEKCVWVNGLGKRVLVTWRFGWLVIQVNSFHSWCGDPFCGWGRHVHFSSPGEGCRFVLSYWIVWLEEWRSLGSFEVHWHWSDLGHWLCFSLVNFFRNVEDRIVKSSSKCCGFASTTSGSVLSTSGSWVKNWYEVFVEYFGFCRIVCDIFALIN